MDLRLVAEALAVCQGLSICGLALLWRHARNAACSIPHCRPGRGGRHNFAKSSTEETNKQVRHIYVCAECDAREIRTVDATGKEVLSGYA